MSNKQTQSLRPQIVEVFGLQVPTSDYYLHRGHSWAVVEDTGRCGWDWMPFLKKF